MKKTIKKNRMLGVLLSVAVAVSMFTIVASAADYEYSATVAANSTATPGAPYLYQDVYTVANTNSGTFNCSVWFQNGSNIIGQKTMYYNTPTDYVITWKPSISLSRYYSFNIYNNRTSSQLLSFSITRGV